MPHTVVQVPLRLQLFRLHHAEVGVEPLIRGETSDDESEDGDQKDGYEAGNPDAVGERVHKCEQAWSSFFGLHVDDGDADVHPRHGELDSLHPFCGY